MKVKKTTWEEVSNRFRRGFKSAKYDKKEWELKYTPAGEFAPLHIYIGEFYFPKKNVTYVAAVSMGFLSWLRNNSQGYILRKEGRYSVSVNPSPDSTDDREIKALIEQIYIDYKADMEKD